MSFPKSLIHQMNLALRLCDGAVHTPNELFKVSREDRLADFSHIRFLNPIHASPHSQVQLISLASAAVSVNHGGTWIRRGYDHIFLAVRRSSYLQRSGVSGNASEQVLDNRANWRPAGNKASQLLETVVRQAKQTVAQRLLRAAKSDYSDIPMRSSSAAFQFVAECVERTLSSAAFDVGFRLSQRQHQEQRQERRTELALSDVEGSVRPTRSYRMAIR